MKDEYNENVLEDMLPLYYKRLFPYKQYHSWLSYGNVDKTYFSRREFSFTLRDDIYLRYQSFADADQLEAEILKCRPHKIDIGAVFTNKPKDHRTVGTGQPLEKELVFDIDMSDYDDVRYCCSGAEMCRKCWPLMVIAIKVIDAVLRDDFGFDHRLWVFSGRRGVHCWVCDEGARKLTQTARSAISEYCSLVGGSEHVVRKVVLIGDIEYPFFERSLNIIRQHFEDLHINNQDFLENEERWKKILALVVHENTRLSLQEKMKKLDNSAKRWSHIESLLSKPLPISQKSSEKKSQQQQYPVEEILLQLCYPRLDVNVTKGLNHLLKSPFCVHPKTGRVCVPIDIKNLDTFNPFTVPTICKLVNEINKHDAEVQMAVGNSMEGIPLLKDYKKTSLCHSIEVFKEFVKGLKKSSASNKRLSRNEVTDESW